MKYLQIFQDKYELLERLDDAARGQLLMAMIRYQESGEEPQLDGAAYYVWPVFRDMIDQTRDSYERKSAAGSKGGSAKSKQNEAEGKQTEAEPKQNEAKGKQTEAEEKQTKAKAHIIQESISKNKKQETVSSSSSSKPSSSDNQAEEELRAGGVSEGLIRLMIDSNLVRTKAAARQAVELCRVQGEDKVNRAFATATECGGATLRYVKEVLKNGTNHTPRVMSCSQPRGPKIVAEQCYHQREITEEINTADNIVEQWRREHKGEIE